MSYTNIRPKIKSGDVLAWSHKGWGTWYDIQMQIIRMSTRSEFNHVGIAWVVSNRVFIIEAVYPKVRIYPLSKELPFYWLPTGGDWWTEVEEFALSKVGEEYSKIDAIKAFFNQIKPGSNNVWQCAELINIILQRGSVFDRHVTSTPTAIVEELMNKGYPVTKVNL